MQFKGFFEVALCPQRKPELNIGMPQFRENVGVMPINL
jgi:hypothetical protein